jgi:hypothetical protein
VHRDQEPALIEPVADDATEQDQEQTGQS